MQTTLALEERRRRLDWSLTRKDQGHDCGQLEINRENKSWIKRKYKSVTNGQHYHQQWRLGQKDFGTTMIFLKPPVHLDGWGEFG